VGPERLPSKAATSGLKRTLELIRSRDTEVVVLAWPDRAAAERWYNSPEYQAILPIRLANSTGVMTIVDGCDG